MNIGVIVEKNYDLKNLKKYHDILMIPLNEIHNNQKNFLKSQVKKITFSDPVLKIVKENYERLRNEYLKWIEDFPNQNVDNITIKNFLDPKNTDYPNLFSTLLYEKNTIKENSKVILTCLKMMIIEEIITNKDIKILFYNGDNIDELKTLKILCDKIGIKFKHKKIVYLKPSLRKFLFKNKILSASFIFFRQFLRSLFSKTILNKKKKYNFTFLIYFPFFDYKNKNKFESNYVQSLNKVLDKYKIRYLLFYNNVKNFSYLNFLKILKEFKKKEKHDFILLDELVNPLNLPNLFLKAVYQSFKNKNLLTSKIFKMNNRNLNLYYIHEYEWEISVCGLIYMKNFILNKIFRNLSINKKKNDILFYPLEMQGWEAILNSNLNKEKIISVGFVHTIIKSMSLKYFSYDFSISKNKKCLLPKYVATNGELSKSHFIENGIKKEKILEIEAQRFQYLNNFQKTSSKNILIALPVNTCEKEKLINLANYLFDNLKGKHGLIIRPHPTQKIDLKKIRKGIKISTTPMLNDLSQAYCLISTINSSTLFESSYLNCNTYVFNPNNDIIYKNFKYEKNFQIFSSKLEILNRIIDSQQTTKNNKFSDNDDIYLDKNFNRWKNVISKLYFKSYNKKELKYNQ